MGREVRRVPPNWQHPRTKCKHWPTCTGGECYQPLHNKDIQTAGRRWLDECIAWDNGAHPDLVRSPELKTECPFFWMWEGNPPNAEYHRPAWPEGAATAYQVYETVSEGTPVSPVFATADEMVSWLIGQGHSHDSARELVERGWAPSMFIANGQIAMNVDALDLMRTPSQHAPESGLKKAGQDFNESGAIKGDER